MSFPPLSLNSTLKFGKYKDETIANIIRYYPEYISWALNNKVFLLDEESMVLYRQEIMEINYSYWVEDEYNDFGEYYEGQYDGEGGIFGWS